jgi:hypothetical protein
MTDCASSTDCARCEEGGSGLPPAIGRAFQLRCIRRSSNARSAMCPACRRAHLATAYSALVFHRTSACAESRSVPAGNRCGSGVHVEEKQLKASTVHNRNPVGNRLFCCIPGSGGVSRPPPPAVCKQTGRIVAFCLYRFSRRLSAPGSRPGGRRPSVGTSPDGPLRGACEGPGATRRPLGPAPSSGGRTGSLRAEFPFDEGCLRLRKLGLPPGSGLET